MTLAFQFQHGEIDRIRTPKLNAVLADLNAATAITTDPTIAALAALTGAADKLAYFNGVDTMALADFPAFGRTLVANASAADARTDLAISATNTPFTPAGAIAATDVQGALAELDTEKLAISSYTAADVLAKLLTVDGSGSGLDADLLDGHDTSYFLARANHTGTQAFSTLTGTPTTLSGYGITDAQPLDSDLTTIAGLTATTDNFIVSVASAWASRTPAQVRTTLGLVIGTDVQAYDADLTTWATVTPGTGVTTALAIAVGSAGAFVTFNGAGGTPSSLTLTNATGLPISGLTASTVTAIGVGSIELGHASDTSITRVSAGVIAVEGSNVLLASGLGSITQAYDATLAAWAAYNTNGLLTQTAADTFVGRTITGTANEITVADGSGVGGNPTLSLPSALTFTGKTVTGGQYDSVAGIEMVNAVSNTISFGPTHGGAAELTITSTYGVENTILSDTLRFKNAGASLTYGSLTSAGAAFDFASASGLKIWDTDSSHRLAIVVGSNLSAARTFTLTTGNANRTLDISAGSVTVSTFGISIAALADAAAARTLFGTVIGTDVQAYDADLTTWAGITPGTGVGTFLATPSSANLAAALTDETGTGACVFAGSPTLTGTLTAAAANFSDSVTLTKAGGNGFTARWNSSNPRVGSYINGSSGTAFIGGNLNWTGTNVFNYDINGMAWAIGDCAGTGSFDLYVATGTAGNDTGYGSATTSRRLQITTGGTFGFNMSSYGGGVGVLGIANATTDPTTNPTGGGVLFVSGGALKFRGSSGTVTTIAVA